jgi:hypothetical protein
MNRTELIQALGLFPTCSDGDIVDVLLGRIRHVVHLGFDGVHELSELLVDGKYPQDLLDLVMRGIYDYGDAFSLSVDTHLKLPVFCELHRERILKAGKDLEREKARELRYKDLMVRWERDVRSLEANKDILKDEYYATKMAELESARPKDPRIKKG